MTHSTPGQRPRGTLPPFLVALVASCGGGAVSGSEDHGTSDGGTLTTGGRTGTEGTGAGATGSTGTTGPAGTSTGLETDGGETDGSGEGDCADGLARHPFDTSVLEAAYDGPSPDFTVQTLRGELTLSEIWNGCDNYVLVIHNRAVGGVGAFWDSAVDTLVDDSEPNTRYLFVVPGSDADARDRLVSSVGARVERALMARGPEAHDTWSDRFHYVTSDANDIPAVAAALATNPTELHVTIDRHQILREGHFVGVYNGGWVLQLSQVRYWPRYYNAQYALDQRFAQEEAAGEVEVFRVADGLEITGEGWAPGHPMPPPTTLTFPDAATLGQYDRLLLDLRVACPGKGHPYATTCGEWDTVGSLMLCRDEGCTPENRRRIVKWITPYSAPGRWVFDLTPELVALAPGGDLRFVARHGDNDAGPYTYRYTADLRLSKTDDGLRPIAIDELIAPGTYPWDATFHDRWSDLEFTPPEGTKKVELYARITGHGAASGTDCAEFCTFTHRFTVNGIAHAHTYEMEGTVHRCAELVAEGVTPNQGGTWAFDRSSWCPGWTTEEWREDITDSTVVGVANVVDYVSTFRDGDPGGGSMDMRVEVVYYGD